MIPWNKANGIFLALIFAAAILMPACQKDRQIWKPDAVLVMNPDSGLTTQTFDFRIDMLNLPASQEEYYVRWDLDGDSVWDAGFSSNPVATHRFYQKGIQTVKVEILTEDGQRFTLQKNVRIDQGYSAPHVNFTIDPPIGNYLDEFTFDAGKTFDDEDPFSSLLFRWDFDNNGAWDTEPSSNPLARLTFKKADNYRVKLSVTDPSKRTAAEIKELEVNLHDDLILPDFIWTPAEATVKDTFLLDASATHHAKDTARIFSYSWDIKAEVNYGPFEVPQFSHVFWNAGKQEVTLRVKDQYGLSNSVTREFYVIKENKPPRPKIEVSTPYGNITTNFLISAWPSMDDVTPPSNLLIRWDFESDGTWDTEWSYEKELFHQFAVPGTYWITLEAEDEGGERASGTIRILVSPYAVQTGFIRDKRNDKYYGTVKIGNQWWMSDNLDYRSNPKMDIPMFQKCYDESEGMCDLYGSMYQGERTMAYQQSGRNICPEGWRLPTREDWLELGKHIPAVDGGAAMMVGGSMGFNGRYTGYGWFQFILKPYKLEIIDTLYYSSGLYEEVKYISITKRPFLSEYASQFYLGLKRNFDGVDLMWGDLNGYFYIRCLRDE